MTKLRQDPYLAEVLIRLALIAASFALAIWIMR